MEDPSVTKLLEGDYLGFLEGIAGGWKGWRIAWDERGVDAFAEHLKQNGISGIETPPASHPPIRHPRFSIRREGEEVANSKKQGNSPEPE